MMPYEGVIRKRLRLKGHPEIPPYEPTATSEGEAEAQSSEQTAVEGRPTEPEHDDEITPVREKRSEGTASEEEEQRQRKDSGDKQRDKRTEAERRRDEIMTAREEERIRKDASKSYREEVDVRFIFIQTNFTIFG